MTRLSLDSAKPSKLRPVALRFEKIWRIRFLRLAKTRGHAMNSRKPYGLIRRTSMWPWNMHFCVTRPKSNPRLGASSTGFAKGGDATAEQAFQNIDRPL